ncbi:hypothetical protein LSG31_12735 [Fodinisporobacter ferrooxydans]|uniref:Uncharacterized protein n=1 Tax=Fodinisporobacter ferrooxydans TaxID=2901836 RepID=A0ABY4CE68_9BACL|nr:hypothetical protein LSG31_12735 [Alicyclobacillaceae bacterium MYW30-H2]
MTNRIVTDILFIRLQASLFCRNIQNEADGLSFIGLLSQMERQHPTPFYIVHEWLCSRNQPIVCREEIQLVNPDGRVEAHVQMSPFTLGTCFWDRIRIYWEVTDFHPDCTGIFEIRTRLFEVETEKLLYFQTDPLWVV